MKRSHSESADPGLWPLGPPDLWPPISGPWSLALISGPWSPAP